MSVRFGVFHISKRCVRPDGSFDVLVAQMAPCKLLLEGMSHLFVLLCRPLVSKLGGLLSFVLVPISLGHFLLIHLCVELVVVVLVLVLPLVIEVLWLHWVLIEVVFSWLSIGSVLCFTRVGVLRNGHLMNGANGFSRHWLMVLRVMFRRLVLVLCFLPELGILTAILNHCL